MNIRDNTLSERERLFIAATRVHTACKFRTWYITSAPNGKDASIDLFVSAQLTDAEEKEVRGLSSGFPVNIVVDANAIPWDNEGGTRRAPRRGGRR